MAQRQTPRQQMGKAEEAEVDVVALLEANRRSRAASQLDVSQRLYDEALAENQRLEQHAQALEQEHYETAALFRRELLAKCAEVEQLQAQLEEQRQQQVATEGQAAAREAALLASCDAERLLLHEQAADLQAQLDSLEEFRQQSEALSQEMQGLREQLEQQDAEHQAKVRALQRQLREYKDGEGSDEEGGTGKEASALDDEDAAAIGLPFAADLARLLQHNRKMNEQMRLFGEEAEDLQQQMKALEAERAALVRDVQLKEDLEQQFAKRGTLQAREIKAAHSKISTLERGMAELAVAFEQEKAALSQGLRAQVAEAVTEQASMRRLLRLRTQELQRVRRLAQEVLLQRSDVEAFLISSIQLVRAEAAAMPVAAAAAGAADAGAAASSDTRGTAVLPQGATTATAAAAGIASSPTAASSSSNKHDKVDIKDLSWGDRERVLRLLFSKINHAAATAAVAAALPRHGLSPERSEAVAPLRGVVAQAGPAALA